MKTLASSETPRRKAVLRALLTSTGLALLLGACATKPTLAVLAPPIVPEELQPPASERIVLVAFARGVQIYECQPRQDDATRRGWVFKAPEADLFDAENNMIGRHFAGPVWESTDGSKVRGKTIKQEESSNAKSIPWVLLTATTNSGSGVFSRVSSIQRVKTVGGKPPRGSCDKIGSGERIRVPYTALYYFYTRDDSPTARNP
jgi:hypothetical protein